MLCLATIGFGGALGAAYALLLVYLIQAFFIARLSQRLYAVPFEWIRIAKIALSLLLASMGVIALRFVRPDVMTPWLQIPVFVGLVAATLVALRFLDPSESAGLRREAIKVLSKCLPTTTRGSLRRALVLPIRWYLRVVPLAYGRTRLMSLGARILGTGPHVVCSCDNRRFKLRFPRDCGWERLYFLRTFETGTTEALSKILRADDVTIDVGANIGWYTTLFARSCPRQLCPERPRRQCDSQQHGGGRGKWCRKDLQSYDATPSLRVDLHRGRRRWRTDSMSDDEPGCLRKQPWVVAGRPGQGRRGRRRTDGSPRGGRSYPSRGLAPLAIGNECQNEPAVRVCPLRLA